MIDIVEIRGPGAVTLALAGRLDGTTATGFETRVLTHIDAGDTNLVLDLADLAYISSVGLRVFLVAAKRLQAVDGRLVLCAAQPPIKQVFDIAGFVGMFTFAPTREDALELFSQESRGPGPVA